MPADQPDNQTPRDDADWVELLRGREAPGAQADTVAEARALRAAIRAREASALGSAPGGLDRLLFRLKREGLLDEARAGGRLRPVYMAIAAALVAAIALPIVLQMQGSEDDTPYKTRSLSPALRLEARDPAQTAEALAQALRTAGAEVSIAATDGRVTLSAGVPAARLADIGRVLRQFGVSGEAREKLRIDVVPSSATP